VRGGSGGNRWGWKTNGRRRVEGGNSRPKEEVAFVARPAGGAASRGGAWGCYCARRRRRREAERVKQRVSSGATRSGDWGRLGLDGWWGVGELGVRVRDFLLGFWNLGRRNIGLLGSLCCWAASQFFRLTEKRTGVFGSPEPGSELERFFLFRFPVLSVPFSVFFAQAYTHSRSAWSPRHR
jgi:hypothetical protein